MILILCSLFIIATAKRFEAFKTTHAYHFKVLLMKDRLKATIDPKTRYLRIVDKSVISGSGFSRIWKLPVDADLQKTHMERIPNYLHVVIPKKIPRRPTFKPLTDTYVQRGHIIQIISETSDICVTSDGSIPSCDRYGFCKHGDQMTSMVASENTIHLKARACQYGAQSQIAEAIYNIVDDLFTDDVLEIDEVIDLTKEWEN